MNHPEGLSSLASVLSFLCLSCCHSCFFYVILSRRRRISPLLSMGRGEILRSLSLPQDDKTRLTLSRCHSEPKAKNLTPVVFSRMTLKGHTTDVPAITRRSTWVDTLHIFYRSFLNWSILSPASCTIPAIVKGLIGFALGMVITRSPSVIVICLPCRVIQKPAFAKALTAR
jgi:hypothetical protein